MQGARALLACILLQSVLNGHCQVRNNRRRKTDKRSLSLSTIQILNETIPCSTSQADAGNDSNYVRTTNGTRLRRLALDDDHMMEVLRQKGGAFLPTYMATNPVRAKKQFLRQFRQSEKLRDPSFHPRRFDANDDNYKTKRFLLNFLSRKRYRTPSRRSASDTTTSGNTYSDDPYRDLRMKRTLGGASGQSADAGETVVGYCQGRGAESPDGYIHMCTVCAATTTLPEDRFPRVINEEICDASDQVCFVMQQTVHGACKQRKFNLNLLRKKEGACARAVVEGQEVLVDEWELYTHQLRVGCECMINKDSLFAGFMSGRR